MKTHRKPAATKDKEPKQKTPVSDQEISDPVDAAVSFSSNGDLCQQLLDRYSASKASHHRHLCATAAAMRSLLLEDALPLTPLSYFAATITSLSEPSDDTSAEAALSTFLSILLPLVPVGSISGEKAVEAAEILVRVLNNKPEEGGKEAPAGTSSVKCFVKCLGVLMESCDLANWDSVRLPVETLLKYSIDKRPKVRKVAQVCILQALKSFKCTSLVKKTSKLMQSLITDHTASVTKGDSSEKDITPELENSEILHVLNLTKILIPHLDRKISLKVVSELLGLLKCQSSLIIRPILEIIEAFLENSSVEITSQIAEDIISSLSSHICSKKSNKDAVPHMAKLLAKALDILRMGGSSKWIKNFPVTVRTIASLLKGEKETASQAESILINLVNHQMGTILASGSDSQPLHDEVSSGLDSEAASSVCSIFNNLLKSRSGVPNEHILSVLSVLFLKLGDDSFADTKGIILKLSELLSRKGGKVSKKTHLQKCIGCAVVAMGPKNILDLVPISFNADNLSCSNTWMFPILRKYIVGASLEYFMEYIVPTAESITKSSCAVEDSAIQKDLLSHARSLWGLLVAFCRHPTDITSKFESLAKLLVTVLEKDTSILADLTTALKELVKQNLKCKDKDGDVEPADDLNKLLLEDCLPMPRCLLSYSKKEAKKNMKALSLGAKALLPALTDMFLNASLEKPSCIKEAIQCLAPISDSSIISEIFMASLKKFQLKCTSDGTEQLELTNGALDKTSVCPPENSERSLIIELASLIIKGAEKNLVGVIYLLVKSILQAGNVTDLPLAYHTLSQILEVHPWVTSSKLDEVVDMVLAVKAHSDVDALQSRLTCLHLLLVHTLKNDTQEEENTKAFLILNDIILLSKDSKEEIRRTAYDSLLNISSSLLESSRGDPDGAYFKLVKMMMGYLSSSSPHMMSAAISALSALIYKEPGLCTLMPELVSSVTSLLIGKAVEVVKAALGFLKVLVSCVEAGDLQSHLPGILKALMPWSSVSRHHFREKVTTILEIMVRKCGTASVQQATPAKFHSFLRVVLKNRRGKSSTKDGDSTDVKEKPDNASATAPNRGQKRMRNEDKREGGRLMTQNHNKRVKRDHQSKGSGETGRPFGGKAKRERNENMGANEKRKRPFGNPAGKLQKKQTESVRKNFTRKDGMKPGKLNRKNK